MIRLPDFCTAEHLGRAVTVVDVVAGINVVVGASNGGAEDRNVNGCWDVAQAQSSSYPLSSDTTTDLQH